MKSDSRAENQGLYIQDGWIEKMDEKIVNARSRIVFVQEHKPCFEMWPPRRVICQALRLPDTMNRSSLVWR